MRIYYKNSRNEIVDFLSDKIAIQEIETLFNFEWEYSSVDSAEFGGKIDDIYKDTEEKEFTLSIFADDEADFDAVCAQILSVFEYDVRMRQPGRLYVGDYYVECYVISAEYTEFEDLMYATDKKFSAVIPYPAWIRETNYDFVPMDVSENETDLDYSYDYPYDYSNELRQKKIINGNFVPSNFEIIIDGPCIDPMISIGGQIYEVETELENGEYLVINSMKKKVYKVLEDGTQETQFSFRNRDYYIYEKIPEGANNVIWNSDFKFTVTILEERSEPRWI